MEYRKLEITLVSANDLPDIRRLGLMKVYAKVHLMKGSESKSSKKTPVDREGDINPKWNFPVKYKLRESTVKQPGVYVVVKLYCERTLGDKSIGEAVNIPVKSLFDKGLKAEQIISYVVAGTRNGRLNILYSFGERVRVRKPSASGCGSGSGSSSGSKITTALDVGYFFLRGASMLLNDGDDYDDDDHHQSDDMDDYCDDENIDDVGDYDEEEEEEDVDCDYEE